MRTIPSNSDVAGLADVLVRKVTQNGMNLADLSLPGPVLVVFLRHAGCPFCRESLADIAAARATVEGAGIRIVVVHMKSTAMAGLLARYGLADIDWIADRNQELYKAFGLRRGDFPQFLGPRVWFRGLSIVARGHGFGWPDADAGQLAGAFLIHRCEVLRRFRAMSPADRIPVAAVAGGV
ncbi:MAG: redoxin domain-containing protein [Bryobacteraceae bacterium]